MTCHVRTFRLLVILSAAFGSAQAQIGTRPYRLTIPLGIIEPDIPRGNQLTAAKIALGKKLFFDPRLSLDRRTSCATCHDPKHAFAEDRTVSVGSGNRQLRRNAPTVLNAGFLVNVMWDGKFQTLEDQAKDPFTPWGDMGIYVGDAIDRIADSPDYRNLFEQAFGSPVSVKNMCDALATYERSLLTGNTRFDRYLYGREGQALSEMERQGFEIFIGQGSCVTCHDVFHPDINELGGAIATFSDQRYHNLGVGYENGRMTDLGRYERTRDPSEWGSFRTPTLRNVALTAPYMHDGSLATLEDVVDFYNRGGKPNRNLSPGLHPLYLTSAEKRALVAFLRSLTDPQIESQAAPGIRAKSGPIKATSAANHQR